MHLDIAQKKAHNLLALGCESMAQAGQEDLCGKNVKKAQTSSITTIISEIQWSGVSHTFGDFYAQGGRHRTDEIFHVTPLTPRVQQKV